MATLKAGLKFIGTSSPKGGKNVVSTDPRKDVVKQMMFRRHPTASKLTLLKEKSPGVFTAHLMAREAGEWKSLGFFELDAANCENAGVI